MVYDLRFRVYELLFLAVSSGGGSGQEGGSCPGFVKSGT